MILTSEEYVAKYANMGDVRGRYSDAAETHAVVESNLTASITECINNEIVLRSVTDAATLFQVGAGRARKHQWMKGTFFYIRVHKNPQHYHIVPDPSLTAVPAQHAFIDAQLREMLLGYVTQLQLAGGIPRPLSHTDMLAVDSAQRYVPRVGGVMMQRFYLKFDSAVLVMNTYSCESEEALLLHVSKAAVRDWM